MTAPTLSAAILVVNGATEGEWSSHGHRIFVGAYFLSAQSSFEDAEAIVAAVNWLKSDEPKELLAVLAEARECVVAEAEHYACQPVQESTNAKVSELQTLLHRIDRLTAAGGGCD